MKTPPLLPEETLHRVLRVANFNGLSVLAVAGMLTLAVASTGNYFGVAVGLLISAAGAFELHGAGLLRAGDSRGMNWLIGSQPYLLVVVLVYCAWRVANFDPSLLQMPEASDLREALNQSGFEESRFRTFYVVTYAVLAIATMIYQGAMTMYYVRRRSAVVAAIDGDDEPERFN